MKFLFAALFACLIVCYLIPCLIKWAVINNFVDQPTERKNHDSAKPLVGGLAMYIAFALSFILFIKLDNIKHIAILVGSLLVMSIGMLDDYYKTHGKEFRIIPRVIIQVFAAMILYISGIRFTGFMNPLNETYVLFSHTWQFILTILWVFGVMTVINFSDGLDGLAGGFSCISAITLFITALYKGQTISAMISMILIGTILGFLKYNFHPAKIFMGDSGASFLGYILAVISLHGAFKQATIVSVFIPVLALGVPIFDNIFVVIKRLVQHKPIYKADATQIHHRLLNSGMTTTQVVKYLFLINACLNLTSIIILLLKI